MAGYGWEFRRGPGRGGSNPLERGGSRRRSPHRGRYDAAGGHGWGAHLGESYIENYGSYDTPGEGGVGHPGYDSGYRFGRSGGSWERGAVGEGGRGRWGWETTRGGYGSDYGRPGPRVAGRGYDRGYGRGGYDRGFGGRRGG